ncbi:MAG: hypothetical protein RIS92_451 [Verrucomicrobiota bacterium]|jgi:hypothetical protein
MESFLADRSPVPDGTSADFDYSSLALGDDSGFGMNGFGGDSASGGFVSLFDVYGVGRHGGKAVDAAAVVDSEYHDAGSSSAIGAMSGPSSQGSAEAPMATVEPHVEVVTVNGRVEKIIVTCSGPCRVELDCSY